MIRLHRVAGPPRLKADKRGTLRILLFIIIRTRPVSYIVVFSVALTVALIVDIVLSKNQLL